MSYEEIHNPQTALYDILEQNSAKNTNQFNVYEFLAEIVSKMSLPQVVTQDVVKQFKIYKDRHSYTLQNFKDGDLAVYLLYRSLKLSQTPRTFKELMFFSGVSSKNLWKIESIFSDKNVSITTFEILASRYTIADLTYQDLKKMKIMCGDIDHLNFSPMTKSCFILYTFCKKNKKKISMQRASSIFGVSTMSLHRIKTYVNHHIPKSWSW